jgi:hypothetical protein
MGKKTNINTVLWLGSLLESTNFECQEGDGWMLLKWIEISEFTMWFELG